MNIKKVLTIAGSDSSGGAGIQADLKTMSYFKVFGMSVITSITAQNTMGASKIQNLNKDIIKSQIDAVFSDILPDYIKIGMLGNKEIIETVFERLEYYNYKNIVLDPVMVSTSGSILLEENAIETLKNKLIPISYLITPNIYEAEILADMKIKTKDDMEKASLKIKKYFKGNILIKGGHLENQASDLLVTDKNVWFNHKKLDNPNTHGTGCTLSSALASNLAKNLSLEDATNTSINYLTDCISKNLNLGSGKGPLLHF